MDGSDTSIDVHTFVSYSGAHTDVSACVDTGIYSCVHGGKHAIESLLSSLDLVYYVTWSWLNSGVRWLVASTLMLALSSKP